MGITVKVQFDPKAIINKMNVKKAAVAVANEVVKDSTRFIPLRESALSKNYSIKETKDGAEITWNMKYAHYMWEGKLYVDPITKKGAFFSPQYGFWSRPGVKKKKTDIPLNFHGGRGPRWTERAQETHYNKWVEIAEKVLKEGLS